MGARQIAPSIWLGGDLSSLASVMRNSSNDGNDHVRAIQGYLGWTSSRLKTELQRGLWVRIRCEDPEAAKVLCMPNLDFRSAASFPGYLDIERPAGSPSVGWSAALRSVGLHSLADFPRDRTRDITLRKVLDPNTDKFSLIGLEPTPDKRPASLRHVSGPRRRDLFGS